MQIESPKAVNDLTQPVAILVDGKTTSGESTSGVLLVIDVMGLVHEKAAFRFIIANPDIDRPYLMVRSRELTGRIDHFATHLQKPGSGVAQDNRAMARLTRRPNGTFERASRLSQMCGSKHLRAWPCEGENAVMIEVLMKP